MLSTETLYPVAEPSFSHRTARFTGETRPPRKGEWFLSGCRTMDRYAYDGKALNRAELSAMLRELVD